MRANADADVPATPRCRIDSVHRLELSAGMRALATKMPVRSMSPVRSSESASAAAAVSHRADRSRRRRSTPRLCKSAGFCGPPSTVARRDAPDGPTTDAPVTTTLAPGPIGPRARRSACVREHRVRSPERSRQLESVCHGQSARLAGGDAICRTAVAGPAEVERGRDAALAVADEREDELERTRSALRVTDVRLRPAHSSRAELAGDGGPFDAIITFGAGCVRAHELDVLCRPARVVQRAANGPTNAVPGGVGCRLVKAIGGEPVPTDRCPGLGSTTLGVGRTLEHDEAGTLAERGTRWVAERSARLCAENTERGEPRKRFAHELIGASRDDDVGMAPQEQVTPEANRVGR